MGLDAVLDLVARPLSFAGLAAVAFLPLEHLFAARAARGRGPASGVTTDLAFATAGQVLASVGLAFAAGAVLAPLERFAVGASLWAAVDDGHPRLRFLLELACGLFVFDLAGYAAHRLAHRVPWLWRLHEVHHSSQTMDWLASFRQHPLEIAWMTIAQNAPLVVLGIPLGAHAAVIAALQLHTVFVHANVRVPVGPWRLLVATPSFHHRHHQRDGAVRNYAALFPVLDRLFRTEDLAPAGPAGVARPIPMGFLGLLAHPLRARVPACQSSAPGNSCYREGRRSSTWTAYKPFEPSEERPA